MPRFTILAPSSVFRALDDLGDEDYDLLAEAIFALGDDPLPPHAVKLRMPNARIRMVDGTTLSGSFLRVRCRSATGGQSVGFRIIYVVDTARDRVCVARVARRGDDTYTALDRALRGGRFGPLGGDPDETRSR